MTAGGVGWRHHYDRLHLHTVRWLSALPGRPIDRREGRWVSRDGVVRYLEAYARQLGLNVRRSRSSAWCERTAARGSARRTGDIGARFVVVATGFNSDPALPDWPGAACFECELLHSALYRNPIPYRGKDVLVVGTGNSGAEIAVDLVEGGARDVMLSVRTAPNILRRDLGGLPSQAIGVVIRRLPVRVVDRMALLLQRLTVGDLAPYGMPAPAGGLLTRVSQDSIPILDVGLIRMLKERRVRVVPAVTGFDGPRVLLAGGGAFSRRPRSLRPGFAGASSRWWPSTVW